MLKVDNDVFEKYVKNNYLTGDNAFSAVILDDDQIYLLKGTKISSTRQPADQEKQSKEIKGSFIYKIWIY